MSSRCLEVPPTAEALTVGKPWCAQLCWQDYACDLGCLHHAIFLAAAPSSEPLPLHFGMCVVGMLREVVSSRTETQSFHELLRNSRNSLHLYLWGFLFFSVPAMGKS